MKGLAGVAVAVALGFQALLVSAATMSPSPASGTYTIGKTFVVNVSVSSPDQPINAVSGVLTFPADKLEVLSVGTGGSVVNLWAQQPSFSNGAGTVTFEGIVLNPGFTGSGGRVVSVSFRAKAAGSATVSFRSGSVLANDGRGSNVLTGLGSARYSIEVQTTGPAAGQGETPSPITGTPPAPAVSSPTHSDPERWYASASPEFSWPVPAGVTSARLLVSRQPQEQPSVSYTPAIASRKLDGIDDGEWYLHVQLKSAAGWGGVAHFRFRIDTKPPTNLTVTPQPRPDPTDPVSSFELSAEDAGSGVDRYDVQLDGGEATPWRDDGSHVYRTPALAPGRHTLAVKAIDGAGNGVANFVEFEVQPIEAPKVTSYTSDLTTGQKLAVSGTTYPGARVQIFVRPEGDEPFCLAADGQQSEEGATCSTLVADESGEFSYRAPDGFDVGRYRIWLRAVDGRGASSNPTEEMSVSVAYPEWWRIGSIAISVLSVIVPLVALLVLLTAMLLYARHKLRNVRRRLAREVNLAEQATHQAFNQLRFSASQHVQMLEKVSANRKLTREEAGMVTQMKRDLDVAEKAVSKEIRDISDRVA